MVKFDEIRETGWKTKTLTEDIEFSLINIAKGNKLGWATDAIVYDEQPATFGQSWIQRARWTVGHLQCFKYYTKDLANGVIENKTLMNFDGLLYMMNIPVFIISLILSAINVVQYLMSQMTFGLMILNIIQYLAMGYLLLVLTAIVVLIVDKRSIKKMFKGILMYPIFMFSWVIINIFCLFKRNIKWKKIEHNRNISIKEVK